MYYQTTEPHMKIHATKITDYSDVEKKFIFLLCSIHKRNGVKEILSL